MADAFDRFARRCANALGTPWAFALAVLVVLLWAAVGPLAGFTDAYQLVINTGTTIVTFWMVFVIQNTQNRDNAALHLKLDDLLRAVEGARTDLAGLESRPQAELEAARRAVHEGPADTSG